MSQRTAAATGVTWQCAARVASDLERNVNEQERISADITALQEQLAPLQHDHTVLVTVRQALGIAPAPVQRATTPDSAVPAPRKKAPTGPGAEPRTRAKKPAAGPLGRTSAKRSGAQKSASKSATVKTSRLTLIELVRRRLAEHSEPRSAAEVTTALDTAHPERGIKTTVVRTTLEELVAKSLARRTRQGSSVYYTSTDAAGQPTAPAQDEPTSQRSA